MAVRFKKGIDWDYYGIDILQYDYLPQHGNQKNNADYINVDDLREELKKNGVDKNAVRRRFMGIE
jgi:hypothetical protein